MQYTDGIETPRLVTRFVTQADVSVWLGYCRDEVATEFTAMEGKTPEEMAQEWIDFTTRRYREDRYGLQALINRETGEFVGMCGLLQQEVSGNNEVEIGYHLLRQYWGMGYASEAAHAFREYAFENRVADSLVSIIHPLNFKSKMVAMRNGMRLADNHADFRGKKFDLFRITRYEWEQLRNRS